MAFKMVDMARSPDEVRAMMGDMPSPPLYPYGLAISLDENDLAKLDLPDDVEVGDMVDLRAMAQVTSVSKREGADGKCSCRVELQVKFLAVEDEETEDQPSPPPASRRKRYSAKEEAAEGE